MVKDLNILTEWVEKLPKTMLSQFKNVLCSVMVTEESVVSHPGLGTARQDSEKH